MHEAIPSRAVDQCILLLVVKSLVTQHEQYGLALLAV